MTLSEIIKLDTHVVHFIKEGHQEDSSRNYQVRHPHGAPYRKRVVKVILLMKLLRQSSMRDVKQ